MSTAIFRRDSFCRFLSTNHITGLNEGIEKTLCWFNLIFPTAQVKQNSDNVCPSQKINCWSGIFWTCFALKSGANENREKFLSDYLMRLLWKKTLSLFFIDNSYMSLFSCHPWICKCKSRFAAYKQLVSAVYIGTKVV